VCPVSGKIKTKLYSTQEQFPAVLYQVLQEIESEGYVCRELYVDTHAVNISAAAEEVAGMYKMRIIPISGGIPQELAYAESAVRTLGQMSRAQMIGAPHLPHSDARVSISTMRGDFAWLDESKEARESINSPSGINGGSSTIGGRGPMVVRAKSGEYLIDPDGVYLEGGPEQPNSRVMSSQRLKVHGVRVVGCFKGTETDVLQDRTSKEIVELAEEGPKDKKILVLNTMPIPVFQNMQVRGE
jgi:hypothetical protein